MLVSITVTDEAGFRADTVDITIDDRKGYVAAAMGDEIRVWLGYEPQPVYMGRYRVDSIRKYGPRRLMKVSASAAKFSGPIRNTKSRSYHGKTLGQIAGTIAAEHGLAPAIAPELAAIAIPHVDQQTESDLSFLTRLATRYGATFKVADDRLVLSLKAGKTRPSGLANPARILRPQECASWQWESKSRGYCGARCRSSPVLQTAEEALIDIHAPDLGATIWKRKRIAEPVQDEGDGRLNDEF